MLKVKGTLETNLVTLGVVQPCLQEKGFLPAFFVCVFVMNPANGGGKRLSNSLSSEALMVMHSVVHTQ